MGQLYRVKPGLTHGSGDRLKGGDIFEPTPDELRSFGDKFEPVEGESTESNTVDSVVWMDEKFVDDDSSFWFDTTEHTIPEVIAAVEDGLITAKDALEQEKMGKNRITLVYRLEEMIKK